MHVQTFLQANQTELQLSDQRGPKSTHLCPGKGNSDVDRCQNSAYSEEGIHGMNGQGTGCQVTLPKQQHTQIIITDPAEKHHFESEIVPMAEMSFH